MELLDRPVEPPPFPEGGIVAVAPQTRRRVPGWAIAIAGFVVVILLGLIPFLLSESEPPPVVDTTPESVIGEFTDALNTGDFETLLALFADDAACVAPGLPTCADILGSSWQPRAASSSGSAW